jgi:hypothetical protein
MVLTGVNTAADAIFAAVQQRPTYIAHDMRGLLDPPERLRVAAQPGWRVAVAPTEITVTATEEPDGDDESADDGLAIVRAVADAVWSVADTPRRPVTGGDDAARGALERAVAAGALASDSVDTP